LKAVPDTSVASLFSEMGKIQLLFNILSDLDITFTQHVVEEIKNGHSRGYTYYEELIPLIQPMDGRNADSSSIRIISVNSDRLVNFSKEHGLGYGESSVILACMDDPTDTVGILDDGKARKVAKANGVRYTGTIGLIKRGYEICKIEDKSVLMDIVRDISSTRFHVKPWLFQYVMDSEKDKK